MLHFSWVCLCAADPKQNEKFLNSMFYPLMSDRNLKKIKNEEQDERYTEDIKPG